MNLQKLCVNDYFNHYFSIFIFKMLFNAEKYPFLEPSVEAPFVFFLPQLVKDWCGIYGDRS